MTTGIFNTGNFTTDLQQTSFANMITRLMPNGSAPLFGLTSMLADETAVQVEHGFFTKTALFPEMETDNGLVAAGSTTLTMNTTANVLPGMIMRNETTGENIIINSVSSTTTVEVGRSVGSVAAATITDADKWYQVGNAFEESSTRPTANNIIPVRITNLTQIFRNTWALSGTTAATQVIAGESTESESRQDCAALHAADIEKALFFGQKSQGTRNGQPFRTMDGLHNIVSNLSYYPSSYAAVNVNAAGATTNWTQLEGFLDPVFDQATDPKGANERVLFCGGAAKVVLNNIATLTTARGKFRLIEHPLFNSNADWAKMAIGVDLATFRAAYLGGRKTNSKEFNTAGDQAADDGVDAIGGTLTTEMTTVVKNTPANMILTNLTAAAQG